jgi:opacity protein-like surface antigen
MSKMRHFSSTAVAHNTKTMSARLRTLVLICLLGMAPAALRGQALPTATRSGSLQVGGTFDLANTDYRPNKFKGYGFYATFDFKYHFGIEGEFHQVNDPNAAEGIYERTYEIGPRYVLHYKRFEPYVKAMYGRGVFNYPSVGNSTTGRLGANIAFNLVAIGGGVDYRLMRSVNLRAEYEYQDWLQFPPNGLTPMMLNFGAAYHFH